jgi:hypothetical protein
MKIASGPDNASPRLVVQRWLPCECLQPPRIAPHQQQIRNQSIAIAQRQPTLGGDRNQIGHVLGRTHTASGAVDYDADALFAHPGLPAIPPLKVDSQTSVDRSYMLLSSGPDSKTRSLFQRVCAKP